MVFTSQVCLVRVHLWSIHIIEGTKKLSKEKWQSIITLRTEGQSVRKIEKLWMCPQVQSQKPSSATMKQAHMRTAPGRRPKVTSAAEDKFIRVTNLRNCKLTAPQIRAQMNATQSSSSRHISTSTVQRRLHESGLCCYKKTLQKKSNKQKRFVWAKKHKEWTLD